MSGDVSLRREAERSALVPRLGRRADRYAVLGTILLLVLVAGAQGGYFPPSWSWTALALGWVIGLWAVLGARHELGRLDCRVARVRSRRCSLWIVRLHRLVVRSGAVAPRGSARARVRLRASQRFSCSAAGRRCPRSPARSPRRSRSRRSTRSGRGSSPTGWAPTIRSPSIASPARSATGTGSGSSACSGSCSRSASCCTCAGPCGSGRGGRARRSCFPTLYFTFSRGAWVALGIGAAALFLGARERLRMVTAAFVRPAGSGGRRPPRARARRV